VESLMYEGKSWYRPVTWVTVINGITEDICYALDWDCHHTTTWIYSCYL